MHLKERCTAARVKAGIPARCHFPRDYCSEFPAKRGFRCQPTSYMSKRAIVRKRGNRMPSHILRMTRMAPNKRAIQVAIDLILEKCEFGVQAI